MDADTVPTPSAITPAAESLHQRDIQIERQNYLHNIPDPKSSTYPDHINELVSKVKDETGIVNRDLIGLQKLSYKYNTIVGVRPVDKFATGLIEAGYETKDFHIKGKSASWGPQAGLICADQQFSKLENADPARIQKFDAEIEKSIKKGDAAKIPLELESERLETLAKMGVISEMSTPDSNGVRTFTAIAPSGKQYNFEATPKNSADPKLYSITSEHKPIEVLAPTSPGAKPLTADYDLMVVGPAIGDVGPQDNLPVPDVAQSVLRDRVDNYKNKDGIDPNLQEPYRDPTAFYEKQDPDLGNASQRVRNWIPLINNELTLTAGAQRAKIVHHGADTANPATDPSANFPATFALPFKMGRFDEISVIHNPAEFREFVQVAKDNGYQVPLNPLWDDVKDVRRADYKDARDKIGGANPDQSTRLTPDNAVAILPGLTQKGQETVTNFFSSGRQDELPPLRSQEDIANATRFFNEGGELGPKTGRGGDDGSPPAKRARTDTSSDSQTSRPGTSAGIAQDSTTDPRVATYVLTHPAAKNEDIARQFGVSAEIVNDARHRLDLPGTSAAGAQESGGMAQPSERRHRTRITDEKRAEISDYIRQHPEESVRVIASRFNVSQTSVYNIVVQTGQRKPSGSGVPIPEAVKAAITAFIRRNPDATIQEIMDRYSISRSSAYRIKNSLRPDDTSAPSAQRREASPLVEGVDFDLPVSPERQRSLETLQDELDELGLPPGNNAATLQWMQDHLSTRELDALASLPGDEFGGVVTSINQRIGSPGRSQDLQQPSTVPGSSSGPSAEAAPFSDIADLGPVDLDNIDINMPEVRPPHPAGISESANPLRRSANGENGVTSALIRDADGNEAGSLGLGMRVARFAAAHPDQLNLVSASSVVYSGYMRDWPTRGQIMDSINRIQTAEWNRTRHGIVESGLGPREISGYDRQPGYSATSGLQLVDSLNRGFNPQTNRFGQSPRFAMLSYTVPDNLQPGQNVGHVAFVERSFKNPDYMNDMYTYYDPSQGGYSYGNFQQLSDALRSNYDSTYAGSSGFNGASTYFYTEIPKDGAGTSSGS